MADDNARTGYVGVSGVVMSDYLKSANESVSALTYLSFEDVKSFDLFGTALIGSYRWYTNDALDSPIVHNAEGSENGLFLSLSFLRKFDANEW